MRISQMVFSIVSTFNHYLSGSFFFIFIATSYTTTLLFNLIIIITNNILWWPVSTTSHLFMSYDIACYSNRASFCPLILFYYSDNSPKSKPKCVLIYFLGFSFDYNNNSKNSFITNFLLFLELNFRYQPVWECFQLNAYWQLNLLFQYLHFSPLQISFKRDPICF